MLSLSCLEIRMCGESLRKGNSLDLCPCDGNANGAGHPNDPALPHFISIYNGHKILV